MENTENFYKRAGTTDKGKEYENMVIANVVLQLVKNATIKTFHISSNDKNFGAFDDVVIKLETDKGTEVKAMQLKHSDKKTLSIKNLKSKKGDYSISKYFESFQEIGNVADEFIMFTNRPFHADDDIKFRLDGERFYIKPLKVLKPSDSLAISKDVNHFYKFQIIEDEWCIQNPSKFQEYTTFFNKFHLYTNQEKLHVLRNTTAENFKKAFYSNEEIFDKFIKIISEWNIQEGKKEKLNKQWMQRLIALQLLSSQIEPLSFGSVNNKMKILRDAISSFDITLFENKSSETVKQLWGDIGKENIDIKELNRIGRNYQFTARYIDDNNMDNLNSKEFTQMLWLMNKCPLILHECEHFEKAIQLCPDKKFILIGESTYKEWMKSYTVFQNLSNLNVKLDLHEIVMQNFTISIQEKEELNLITAFGNNEDILENVTTDNLMEMLNGPCNIGGKKEILPEPYIERYLSQNIINSTYLEQAQENTIIILNCGSNFAKVQDKLKHCTLIDLDKPLENSQDVENLSNSEIHKFKSNLAGNENINANLANTIYVSKRDCNDSELQQIYNQNPKNTNFHYFKVINDGNLEWVKSKGDVSTLEAYRLPNDRFTNENALWSSHLNTSINLISGDPGMGKSELMKSFKNKCSPKYWTIIINPKDVNSFFRNLQVSKTSNFTNLFEKFIINEKCDSLKTLDQRILEMCVTKNNILYVWDAIDEILSEHLEAVSDLILQFSKKDFVQWVTTRQHLKTFLEKKFNVLSFHINQFSEHEQRDYIRKRLTSFSSVHQIEMTIKKIKSTFVIIEHVDILGIPLQIFMLTELFRRDNKKYLNLLDNTFLLTDLYHYFIEEKFVIFYKDKMGFDLQNPHLASRISEEKQKALSHYERVAFNVIFPEEILYRLNIDCQKHTKKIIKKYASLGLTNEIQNNVLNFLHGSFAEYLVALYFRENFKDIPVDIIFEAKYNNVRFFFDMLVTKNSPAHIAVLYKNFELLQTYDDETLTRQDECGRTPLHLICSWGQRHPRVKIKHETERYIVDDSNSLNSKPESKEYFQAVTFLQNRNHPDEHDTLLDMTPLSYARKSESLGAELKLLQVKKSEVNQSCSLDDRINILYYSVSLGYDEVSELFTVQQSSNTPDEVTFVTAEKGSTPLLLACKEGHIKIVKYLLKSGMEINGTDNCGRTPLYAASFNGHKKTVEYLVKAGADINRAYDDGFTPLYVASQNAHQKTVEFLITSGAQVNHASDDGFAPLYAASQNGHEIIVQYLLKCGADVNRGSNNGLTPLHVASFNGHEKTVEFLVKSGAEINRATNGGMTPLYLASQKGHKKTVEYLVQCGAEINRADINGRTPLYAASFNGHNNTVEYLVKIGAELNRSTNKGCTPLFTAACNGHEKTVEYLVKAGAEINRATNNGCTALYVASENDDEKTIQHLVEGGAHVNAAAIDGFTALYVACHNGHKNTVEYLVKTGAEINRAVNDGATPLHAASSAGHEETVEYLVKAGAEINRGEKNGFTPLYVASQNGHEKTVAHLVKAGAEINRAANDGRTPLFTACCDGHEKSVEHLVKAGAEINRATNDGRMPLHAASANGHEKTVEFLVTVGSEINRADKYGVTPLYVASENGHEKTVEYLMKAGAEINRADEDGYTPLYVASQYGHEKTVEYLIKEGAEINRAGSNGMTPLHAASAKGHTKTIEYLLKVGAETNSATNDDRTPLYEASRHDREKTIQFLVKTAADLNRTINDDFPLVYAASENDYERYATCSIKTSRFKRFRCSVM